MKFFNKYFFIGFGCGAIFVFVFEMLFVTYGLMMVNYQMRSYLEKPELPQEIEADAPQADYGFAVKDLQGHFMLVDTLKGKVLFMNIWATNDPFSRIDMSSIQKLYDKMKDRKDVVFLIMTDEDLPTVQKFMKKNKYTFPVYLYKEKSLPDVFRANTVPMTFIIAPDGKIAYNDSGDIKWDDEIVFAFLDKLSSQGSVSTTSQSTSTSTSLAPIKVQAN